MSGRTYHCEHCDKQSFVMPLSAGTDCFTQQHRTYRFCSYGCLALWAADQSAEERRKIVEVRHYPT